MRGFLRQRLFGHFVVSFSLPFAPGARAPCRQRAARLLSLCSLAPKPGKSLQPKPLSEMSFDDRAHSPLRVDTPQEASHAPARTLAMRIYGPPQIAACCLPQELIQRVSDVASLWLPPSHRPNRSRLLQLRTRRPAMPVFPDLQSFLHRARGEDVRPNLVAEQPIRGPAHSRAAHGSWRVALRSISETSPPNTRWPADLIRHPPKTLTVRCSRAVVHQRHLSPVVPEWPSCGSARAAAIQDSGTYGPAAARVAHQDWSSQEYAKSAICRFINLERSVA